MNRADRLALLIAMGSAPLRLALALSTDLSPDEAYYLSASRLGVRIPDPPPLLIWLLHLSDGLPAAVPLQLRVRLWPLLFGTLIPLLLVAVMIRRYRASAATQRWVAVLSAWLPLPLAGGFLATPDAPAALAITLLIALAPHPSAGTQSPQSSDEPSGFGPTAWLRGGGLRAAASGCVAWLGTVAKVSVAPAALPFALLSRRALADKTMIAAALAAATPLVLPSLLFQLHHAFASETWTPGAMMTSVGAAIGGQLAIWTPMVVVLGLGRDAQCERAHRAVLLLFWALFLVSAVVRAAPPEPNWMAPAGLVMMIGASRRLPSCRGWVRGGCLLLGPGLALLFASHVLCPWMPLRPWTDPAARLHGWSQRMGSETAAGVGGYGAAAERCVYDRDCTQIAAYIRSVSAEHLKQ